MRTGRRRSFSPQSETREVVVTKCGTRHLSYLPSRQELVYSRTSKFPTPPDFQMPVEPGTWLTEQIKTTVGEITLVIVPSLLSGAGIVALYWLIQRVFGS